MFKKYLGLGLVGKLNTCAAAQSQGTSKKPKIVDCALWDFMGPREHGLSFSYPYELDTLCISEIDKLSQLGVPSHFQHIYFLEDRSIEKLFYRLNLEVGQARRQFPQLRFVRSFRLPTSNHKRQYFLKNTSIDESWLEAAFLAFRESTARPHWIREEYANGSWTPYKTFKAAHVELKIAARLLQEGVFYPYRCHAETLFDREPKCIAYTLTDSRGETVARGQIDVFSFDLWDDLEEAISEERETLGRAGLIFDSAECDLLPLLREYEWEDL